MSKPDWYNPQIGGLAILVAFVSILIGPMLVYSEYGREGIEVSSVIITGLLTLSLVILYFQQYSILEKQTELQHREYRSSLAKRGTIVADGDNLTFRLQNKGRGKVVSMFLKSEITSDTGELDIGFGRTQLKSKETPSTELSPDSRIKEYVAEANFRVLNWKDSKRHYPFRFISSRLSRQDINSCIIKLTLEVVDESIVEGQFSHEFEIARQELQIKSGKEKEITSKEGDTEKRMYYSSTTIEEGLDSDYKSQNDINRKSIKEISKGLE